MNSFAIICLDDDPLVVDRLNQDLATFADLFDIYNAYSIEEARDTLQYIEQNNQMVALVVCDKELGYDNGVEFLVKLDQYPVASQARSILLNDEPQLDAIMQAVNEGAPALLPHATPWNPNELRQVVLKELTTFVLKHQNEDWLQYSQVLDHRRILNAHIERQMSSFRSGFIQHTDDLNDASLAQQVADALHDFFDGNDENRACRTYSENHLLTKEGEPNNFLWFITKGEVALYKKRRARLQA